MADTFFGFNASLNRRENISSPSNDDCVEEEEYDALNDETFGGFEDGSDLDDWEQQHEEFAEYAEHSKQSEEIENSISKLVFDDTDVPILSKKDSVWAYTSPTQKNGDIINQSLLQLLEKSIESKSSQSHSSPSTIANHIKPPHPSTQFSNNNHNQQSSQHQILLSSIKPPNIQHHNNRSASVGAGSSVVDGPSAPPSTAATTSSGKKWTVEELERDLMMGCSGGTGSGQVVSRVVGTPPMVKQQQLPVHMQGQGMQGHPMFGSAGPPIANRLPPGLHPALALRFQQQQQHMLQQQRGIPPHLAMRMPPPPHGVHGVPPPGYMPFSRQPPPPGIGPPMNYPASQHPPYPGAGFPYHQMPPNPNNPNRPPPPMGGYNHQQQQQHPLISNGPNGPPNHQMLMRPPYPQNQQQMMNQQQQHHQHHMGMHSNRQRRDSSGGGGRVRRESGVDDEYAGLMSNREKQWLLNIQLLQLNTETPYFDDYYYTIFKERKSERSEKQNHQRFNQYNKRENNRNNERQENTLTARVYAPQQFENSLGKLQYGSVTAPRKIIDTDLLQPADSESGTTRDLRKTKQLLIELEALYTLLLKAEDLKNPLAVKNVETLRELKQKQRLRELDAAPTPDQKQEVLKLLRAESEPPTESSSAYIARVVQGLLQDDKVNSFLNIRKGKMLLLRLLPHLTPDHFMAQLGDVWMKVLLSIPSVGRRDTVGDNILPQLYPYFKRYVQNCKMSHILDIVSNLVEVVKQEQNSRSTPLSHQGKSPLHFVIGNKFGVSSLVTLLTRTEYLISSSNCTGAQLGTWRAFVVAWSDLSAHAPNVAMPLDPIPRTVYSKHVQRLIEDMTDDDKKATLRSTVERYYVEATASS